MGKNESGKTAVLEALEKLSSVRPDREALQNTEYPRMNWSEYEEKSAVDSAIETEWEMTESERTALVSILGDEALVTCNLIRVSKDYNNDLKWHWPFDSEALVAHTLEASSLTTAEKKKFAEAGDTADLLRLLRAVEEPTQSEAALLADLEERWTDGVDQTTLAYFADRLPKFVYYSQYDRLPGRVSLNQLVDAQGRGALDDLPGSRVFLALLSMVGTTPEMIGQITTSEELISKLEAVETRLSQKIFKYWSQNKHLKVRFRFDEASRDDPAPFNLGKVFQTRIENTRHQATIRLDERSTGFIWFFSFLVWFSEVQREHGGNLIVLLDEPGLTLHARAQADLLRYIKQELITKYQVIYTTHSPFMIDSADLKSCRTVEDASGPDNDVLGTKVGDKLWSVDGDTLFPLQAALGYDITQSLFVGEHCLLVEGPSDLLYLQWSSAALVASGREGLDPRWTVTPCGGITKIPSFLSLFGGNKLHVAVLTDYGQGDKRKVRDMRDSKLLRDGHVFSAEMFVEGEVDEADTEDILGRALYVELVNATYKLTGKNKLPATRPGQAPTRVVSEVEEHFRTLPSADKYDHFTPSSFLLAHGEDFLSPEREAALDRFENLFSELNKLLD